VNQGRFHGIWWQFGASVREQRGTLIGDPLVVAAGRRDRLVARNEKQRGILRQQADRQLVEFISRNRNWQDLSRR
jgi:uncharacterized protein YjbJ (UPF0337 family)